MLFVAVAIGIIAGLSVMFADFGWYEDLDEEYDYYWELTEYIRNDGGISSSSDGWAGTLIGLGLLLIGIAVIAMVVWTRSASGARILGIVGAVLALMALLGTMSAGAAFDKEMEEEEMDDWDFDVGYFIAFIGSLVLMGLMICVVLMADQGQQQAPPPPPPPL